MWDYDTWLQSDNAWDKFHGFAQNQEDHEEKEEDFEDED